MRPLQYAALAVVLAVLGGAAYFALLNAELLAQPVFLTAESSVPLYLLLLLVFGAGFLPSALAAVALARGRDRLDRGRLVDSDRQAEHDERFAHGFDLLADGQWQRAAELLRPLYQERPERLEMALFYGRALGRSGRLDEAADVFRRATVTHPRSTALLSELAALQQARGEDAAAEELRGRLVRDFPERALQELLRRRDLARDSGDAAAERRWQARIDAVEGRSGPVAPLAAGDDGVVASPPDGE